MGHKTQMGTGLFQNRTNNQGLNFGTRKRAPGSDRHPERPMKRQIDIFAENLAQHGDAQRAARQMGLKSSSGNGMLQRLRREVGESQAR